VINLNITARHFKLTPDVVEYINKRVNRIERYFYQESFGNAVVTLEKNRYSVEIILHSGSASFKVRSESIDLYTAIDEVSDKLKRQVGKFKDRIRSARRKQQSPRSYEIQPEDLEKLNIQIDTLRLPKVINTQQYKVRGCSIREALEIVRDSKLKCYPFFNNATEKLSVLFLTAENECELLEIDF